ncbi:MAG: hypothetical protein ACREE6_07095, partial [Limisphaerales bacterium]
MKIQCPCGAKYVIDVTPGMQPVTFVCRNCGQDYSAFVNELIRKETGEPIAAAAPPPLRIAADSGPPPIPAPAVPSPPPPPSPDAPKLRISRAPAAEAPAAQAEPPQSKYCQKHRTELTTDHCQICKKPICPKCLETFGPFCSAFCRNKVEGVSMDAPVHIGGRFAAQKKFWRKVTLISAPIGAVAACLLGFWFWYAWIGSQPHVYFSVRFDDLSDSGDSRIVDGNQLVFLHGGTLARYNLQTKQKIWSLELVSPQDVADALKAQDEENTEEFKRTGSNPDPRPTSIREKELRIGLEQELEFYDDEKNIWVAKGNVLTHYDWATGNVVRQVTLTNDFDRITDHGNELLALGTAADGSQSVTQINMDDGTMQTEEIFGSPAVASAKSRPTRAPEGGLPLMPEEAGRPMNPARVAQQAQHMTLAGRIALPALLANSEHNQQILQEIHAENMQENGYRGGPGSRRQPATQSTAQQSASQVSDDATDLRNFNLIPDGDSYIAFGSRLIKQNIVRRDAMRAPPKHSALNNPNLSAANEQEAVNEQLNEMQRNRGGGTVTEDQ